MADCVSWYMPWNDFVIQDAIQNLPYSMANVQILPDYEQLSTAVDTLEEHAAIDRARAIVQSFQYHAYEYKETPLPLSREKKYFSLQDTYGSWLSDLLPFAPYYLDHALLPKDNATSLTDAWDSPATLGVELSLETRLLNKAIVQNPPGIQPTGLSNDELEAQLWNALEDYCTAKGIQLPDPVLALLPPGRSWLRVPHVWYRRVAAGRYPAQRRQARLSYAAAYFLEQTDVGKGMRQIWLETPTTNARLADLCDRFDIVNADLHVGDFQ